MLVTSGGAAFTPGEVSGIVQGYEAADNKQHILVVLAQRYRVKHKDIREVLAKKGLVDPETGKPIASASRSNTRENPEPSAQPAAQPAKPPAALPAAAPAQQAPTEPAAAPVKPTPGRKHHPPELRKAVIREMAEGRHAADVAARHDVPQKTVERWRWEAKKSGAFAALEKELEQEQQRATPENEETPHWEKETRQTEPPPAQPPAPAPEPAAPKAVPIEKEPATQRAGQTIRQMADAIERAKRAYVQLGRAWLNMMDYVRPTGDCQDEMIDYLNRCEGFVKGLEYSQDTWGAQDA